jgi:hypothetical protein
VAENADPLNQVHFVLDAEAFEAFAAGGGVQDFDAIKLLKSANPNAAEPAFFGSGGATRSSLPFVGEG